MDDATQPPRKNKLWRILITLAVLAGVGSGAFYGINAWVKKGAAAPAVTTQDVTVGYGNVAETLTVAGNLAYYNTQQISFGAAGTIAEIRVSAGDTVAKGDVLATFDDASKRALQKALLLAQTALATAQANLESAKHPYSDADMTAAQAAVTTAQMGVGTAQGLLDKANQPYSDSDIAQAQIALINAQNAVTTAQTNLDKAQHPYSDDQIAAQQLAVQDALTYYTNVCAKTQGQIVDAQFQLSTVFQAYQLNPTAQNLNNYQTAQANLALVQADAARQVKAALDAYNQTLTLLANMQATPDATLIKQRQYELLVAQTNLANATTNLAAMRAAPDPLNIQLKTQQLTIARNNLAKAQQTLADMQAAPSAVTVQLRQIELDNAQSALTLAESQAQSNAIIAPAAGLITAVNIKTGQAISATTDAVDMVDPSVFALSASVSELDIPLVQVGQSAAVSVDALNGMTLSGKVGAVASSSTENSGVVSYKVTLLVTQLPGVSLLNGMSAEADIMVRQSTHVLVVPNKAIGGTTSNPTVQLLVNGAAVETPVKLGLSDDNYTEVTSGLKEGDTVVISSAVKSSSSHTSTSNTKTSTPATGYVTSLPGGVATMLPPGGGIVITAVPFTVQAGVVPNR